MNDQPRNANDLEEERDPFLDTHLSTLQRLTPSSSFADRVLAQVEMPAPLPIRYIERRAPVLLGSGARWALAAASAAGTVLWGAFLSGAVGINNTRLPTVLASLAVQIGLPIWKATLQMVAAGAAQLGAFAAMLIASFGASLLHIVPATIVVTLFCAFCLRRLMAEPRHMRTRAYASV